MHSSRAGTQQPLSSPSISSRCPVSLPPPSPAPVRHRHIEAPLCSFLAPGPLSYAARGPLRGPFLGSWGKNRGDGVIRRLPGGCQLVLGRTDRVAAWWMFVHARIPAPPHTHTDICCVCVCVWKKLPSFVSGYILILHLLGSASRLGPACINCPCLARCLLLITLINFNSPGSRHHSSCFYTHTHTHTSGRNLAIVFFFFFAL